VKKKICLAVITALLIIGGCYKTVQAITSSELEQRRIELREEINKAGKNLENINVQLTENLEAINNLDEQIGEYETQIESVSNNINQVEKQIRETETSLKTIQKRYNHQNELLKKRIVYMYEAGETKYLDVLLNSKSIVDFITRYYLIQEIAQYDRDFLNDIKKEKDEIEKIEESLKTSKGTLKEIKAEQKKLAISLENAKVVKSGYVNNLNEEEIKIQEEISIYQKELDLIELDVLMAALESNGSQYVGGTFAWPAPGYYTITSPYGMRLHPVIKSYRNHSGMDIGAPMGSYAIAANDGVVTKSMYSNSYGNMIMIDHGGGVTTLYAHGSELIARVGDKVKRGDAIMKVGSTGWSTGPHLHFEIRINGQTIDPYPYVTSNGNT
jgi:murein DD-endopeptidase MepM/ murein hydrolase activator NlpD